MRREVEEAEPLALRAQETAATPETEAERQAPAREETAEAVLGGGWETIWSWQFSIRLLFAC